MEEAVVKKKERAEEVDKEREAQTLERTRVLVPSSPTTPSVTHTLAPGLQVGVRKTRLTNYIL